MKRFYLLLLVFVVAFSAVGCGLKVDGPYAGLKEIDLSHEQAEKLRYVVLSVLNVHRGESGEAAAFTDKNKGDFLYEMLNDNTLGYCQLNDVQLNYQIRSWYPELETVDITSTIAGACWHDMIYMGDYRVAGFPKAESDTIIGNLFGGGFVNESYVTDNINGLLVLGDSYVLTQYSPCHVESPFLAITLDITGLYTDDEGTGFLEATYSDDAMGDAICKAVFEVAKNDESIAGYTFKSMSYTIEGGEADIYYNDGPTSFPTAMFYGEEHTLFANNDILDAGQQQAMTVNVNNRGSKEDFSISRGEHGLSMSLALKDTSIDAIRDFELFSDEDEAPALMDGYCLSLSTADIDGDGYQEVLCCLGNLSDYCQMLIYEYTGNTEPFKLCASIIGRSYIQYEPETGLIHVPYSQNGMCAQYKYAKETLTQVTGE